MAPTYKELQENIQRLTREAEAVRKQELATVRAEIQGLMDTYGLTADDFRSGAKTKSKKVPGDVTPKFQDPVSGGTWSGKGPRPQWLKDAVTAGKSKEEFAI